MASGGGGPLKVFCGYRSVDAAAVEGFTTRLRESGVDAWFDHWEIAAGDDIVARTNAGIDGCQAALVFVSAAWFDGTWAQDEATSLMLRRVEDGIRLIPVTLDGVDPRRLPAGLRKLARRQVDDFEAIRDALLGVSRRPGLDTARWSSTTSRTT